MKMVYKYHRLAMMEAFFLSPQSSPMPWPLARVRALLALAVSDDGRLFAVITVITTMF